MDRGRRPGRAGLFPERLDHKGRDVDASPEKTRTGLKPTASKSVASNAPHTPAVDGPFCFECWKKHLAYVKLEQMLRTNLCRLHWCPVYHCTFTDEEIESCEQEYFQELPPA